MITYVELCGPQMTLHLEGQFWHRRATVLGRAATYLNARMPNCRIMMKLTTLFLKIRTSQKLHQKIPNLQLFVFFIDADNDAYSIVYVRQCCDSRCRSMSRDGWCGIVHGTTTIDVITDYHGGQEK